MAGSQIPQDLKKWIDAKKKSRLSQKHICMAMELGINPRSLASMGANPHELWKSPLPDYLEELYEKRFKRSAPAVVRSFEQMSQARKKPKAEEKPKVQATQPPKTEGEPSAVSADLPEPETDDPFQDEMYPFGDEA